MKKLFALALVIVMVLSMVPTAFAAGSHTITIEGKETGHIYEAYQIFNGTLDKGTGILAEPITWGSGIDGDAFLAFLKSDATTTQKIFAEGENTNVFSGVTNAQEVANILSKYADNDKMVDLFAKYAGEYLTGTHYTSTCIGGTTYQITGVPDGYYLIMDSDDKDITGNDVKTKYILDVPSDVTLAPKGTVPSINKTVSDSENGSYGEDVLTSIGTDVWFELTATLPSNYGIYDTYKLTFVDTLSAGLSLDAVFDADDVKVYVVNDKNYTPIVSGKFSVANVTASSFEVIIPNLKDAALNGVEAGKGLNVVLTESKIVVRYKAHLNENAVISGAGNPNSVELEFSNDPYNDSEGTTGPDIALVYTFGLDVDKYDKTNTGKKLNDAEFVLYTRTIASDNTLVLNFAAFDANGVFTEWVKVTGVADTGDTATNWEAAKAELITQGKLEAVTLKTANIGGQDGQISVKGLAPHVYRLLEIKAPTGYNLPKDPFEITMTPIYKTDGTFEKIQYNYNGTMTEKPNGNLGIGVANGMGNTLPSTGGMGTTLFYAIGGIMVLAAVVLLMTKKRMSVA